MRTGGSSAFIAKFLPTLASHGGAAVVPLHPKLASRTLLVLGSADEFDEVFIVFVEAVVDLVLSAAHARVVLALAPQAVVLLAGGTSVVVQLLLEREDCSTTGSGTPGCRGMV
jgi:hypothetical protein